VHVVFEDRLDQAHIHAHALRALVELLLLVGSQQGDEGLLFARDVFLSKETSDAHAGGRAVLAWHAVVHEN